MLVASAGHQVSLLAASNVTATPSAASPWPTLSGILLLVGGAVVPIIHLICWLLEYRSERRVSVALKLRPAFASGEGHGVQVWMHNTGGVTLNSEWVVLESGAASLRLPLHDRPPVAAGRVEAIALRWKDLAAHGFLPAAPIRVRVWIDLGHEFVSRWTILRLVDGKGHTA